MKENRYGYRSAVEENLSTLRGRPGLSYMLNTGRPADGSHGDNTESTQGLVNPRAHNPTSSETVHEWIRARVANDPQMRSAGEARGAGE